MIIKQRVIRCDSCKVLKIYEPESESGIYEFVPEYLSGKDHIPYNEQLRHICKACFYKIFSRHIRDIEEKEASARSLNNSYTISVNKMLNEEKRQPTGMYTSDSEIKYVPLIEKEETPGSDVKPEVPDLSMTSDTELKHMGFKTAEEYLYRIRPPESPDE